MRMMILMEVIHMRMMVNNADESDDHDGGVRDGSDKGNADDYQGSAMLSTGEARMPGRRAKAAELFVTGWASHRDTLQFNFFSQT